MTAALVVTVAVVGNSTPLFLVLPLLFGREGIPVLVVSKTALVVFVDLGTVVEPTAVSSATTAVVG